jgi:hypothetical protein
MKQLFSVLLVVSLIFLPEIWACRDVPIEVRYSIFNQNKLLTGTQTVLPYRFYGNGEAFVSEENAENWQRGRTQNLREWQRYLNIKTLTIKMLDNLVYQGSHVEDYNPKRVVLNNKKTIELLAKNQKTGALAYLKNIHTAQNIDTDDWTEPNKQQPSTSRAEDFKRIDKGYTTATDEFLKARYAYQEVVFAGAWERHDACMIFFEKRLAPCGKKTVLYWWGLDYYAAAIHAKGNPARAMCYYAQVFANDDYKKLRMFQVFDPKYTEKALVYAKNNAEKANILVLAALKNEGRNLKYLQAILKLSPENPQINAVLTKEINKLEDWILNKKVANAEARSHDYEHYPVNLNEFLDKISWHAVNRGADIEYAKNTLKWLETVNQNKKLTNPAFVQLATAYIAFIVNDNITAAKWAKSAENTPKASKNVQQQAHFTKILAEINFTTQPDGNILNDTKILNDLQWLQRNTPQKPVYDETKYYEASHFHSYNSMYGDCILAIASRARAQQNEVYEMLLMVKGNTFYGVREWDQVLDDTEYWFTELDRRNDATLVAALIDKAQNPKTPLETYLSAPIRARINRVYDLLGTIHLRNDSLDKALAVYQKIPPFWWTRNGYNLYGYLADDPFSRYFIPNNGKHFKQNKATIVAKMIDLRDKSYKKDAKSCFLLANAYFNMTYNGNSWAMMRYWWSNKYQLDTEKELLYQNIQKAKHKIAHYTEKNYFTAQKAKFYYEKAMNLAIKQKNKKLAALCLVCMAHCENANRSNESYSGNLNFHQLPSSVRLRNNYPQYATDLLANDGSDCSMWADFLK